MTLATLQTDNQHFTGTEWCLLLGIGLPALMLGLDFSEVNMAAVHIQTEFNLNINQLQWLMMGFGLTLAPSMVVSGRLADSYGRCKVLYWSVLLFAITTLGASLANHILPLIFMRICQGLCAAAFLPCGLAIIAHTFPHTQRTKATGIFGSMLGLGFALGPLLTGAVISLLNWRWVFLINLPIAALALFLCIVVTKLPENRAKQQSSIDYLGMTLLLLSSGSLCLGVSQGHTFGWTSPISIAIFLVTISSSIFLVYHESRCPSPILPIKLLADPRIRLAVALMITAISTSWVVSFYQPLYFHQILHVSNYVTGLLLSIMMVMTILGPLLGVYLIRRIGVSIATHCTFIASILGMLGLCYFGAVISPLLLIFSYVLFGMGWGMTNGISIPIALHSNSAQDQSGLVSGALSTALNTCAICLVSITTQIFGYFETTHFNHLLHHTTLSPTQQQLALSVLSDPNIIQENLGKLNTTINQTIIAYFKESFMFGFHSVFISLCVLGCLLYLLSIPLIRNIKNQDTKTLSP